MKIRIFPIIIILTLIAYHSTSQSVSVEWLKNSGGTSWDLVSDMITDDHDNIYLVGNYSGTPNSSSKAKNGNRDIFIAKYDTEGTNKWLHQMTSDGYCHISSVSTVDDGLLLGGFFNSELKLGSHLLKANNENDVFLAKIDSTGSVKWVNQIKSDFKGIPIFVRSCRSSNDFWFAGSFQGGITIDNFTYSGNNQSEIFLAKFNVEGKIVDNLILHGKGEDKLYDIITDIHGDLILTGSFENDLTHNKCSIRSNGFSDAFYAKINKDLTINFLKNIGGHYNDYGKAIRIEDNGNLLICGSFMGSLNLDSSKVITSNGMLDGFIYNSDAYGNFIWADGFGGNANDYVSNITTNKDGSVYICGSYQGEIIKNNQSVSATKLSSDVFIAKYTNDGEFKYIESFGDKNTDFAKGLSIDKDNFIYLSGNFRDSFKALEKNAKSADKQDYYISKLFDCDYGRKMSLLADTSVCGDGFEIIADSGFASYLWNEQYGTYRKYTDTTGLFHLTVVDDHNCISKDSIQVQVNKVPHVNLGDSLIAKQGEVIFLYANEDMKEYKWSDHSELSFLVVNTEDIEPGIKTYSVKVTDKNNCKNEDDIDVHIINDELNEICEIDHEFALNVTPNPAHNECKIIVKGIDPLNSLQYTICSVSGSIVFSREIVTVDSIYQKSINVSTYNPGTYFIRVTNGSRTLEEKLVIIH